MVKDNTMTTENTPINAFKGLNKDMSYDDVQYVEGQSYDIHESDSFGEEFHACECPIETFVHCAPSRAVYHNVAMDGNVKKGTDGTEITSSRITIGERVKLSEMAEAAVDFVKSKIRLAGNPCDENVPYDEISKGRDILRFRTPLSKKPYTMAASILMSGISAVTKRYSIAKTTNYSSVSVSTDAYSASITEESKSIAASSGNFGTSLNHGGGSAAVTTGPCSVAAAESKKSAAVSTESLSVAVTNGRKSSASVLCGGSAAVTNGNRSVASATDVWSMASTNGESSVACVTGSGCTAKAGKRNSLAVAWGDECMASGALGATLVLTEWDTDYGAYDLIAVRLVTVDGKDILPNVPYTLKNGTVTAVRAGK